MGDSKSGGAGGGSTKPKVGPAANIPEHPGDFLERGYFSVTHQDMYVVRVGPPGSYVDHLFESQIEAEHYARALAASGKTFIRNTSSLPIEWPGGKPGNPVDAVRVHKIERGAIYVQGVVGPQPESATPSRPDYPGGGPQVVLDRRVRLGPPLAEFPVTEPPSGGPGSPASGAGAAQGGSRPSLTSVEEDSTPRSKRARMEGSEPQRTSTAVLGSALGSVGAGLALGIFENSFKDKVVADLAKLPKPKLDERGATEYFADPNVKNAIKLVDLLNKNLQQFQDELVDNHTYVLTTVYTELDAIRLMPNKTVEDVQMRFEHLDALGQQLANYGDNLQTVRDNLDGLLELEPSLQKTKKSFDALRALLLHPETPLEGSVLEHLVLKFGVESINDLDDYCHNRSKEIEKLLNDAHSLRQAVDGLLKEQKGIDDAVNKAWWNELGQVDQTRRERVEPQKAPAGSPGAAGDRTPSAAAEATATEGSGAEVSGAEGAGAKAASAEAAGAEAAAVAPEPQPSTSPEESPGAGWFQERATPNSTTTAVPTPAPAAGQTPPPPQPPSTQPANSPSATVAPEPSPCSAGAGAPEPKPPESAAPNPKIAAV